MLAHTIEAVNAGKITRVHCNTCKAQHAYRPRPPGQSSTGKRTRSSSSARPVRGPLTAGDYEQLMRGRELSNARKYAPSERFARAEVMAHASFGIGLVTAVKDGNKIEVLFKDGLKMLVHGR